MKNKIQGIYKIVNCINNKIYIGQSVNVAHRFLQHKYNIKRNIKHPLYNSIRKYGVENFEFIVIEEVLNIVDLDLRELYWINHYKSNDSNYGYNLRLECTNNRGCKCSDESIKQNSERITKLWQDPEYRTKMLEARKKSEVKRIATIETNKSSDPSYAKNIINRKIESSLKRGHTKIHLIDKDKVKRLYIDENYRLKDVAKILKISYGLLCKFIKINELQKPTSSSRKVKPSITDEQLHQICDSVYNKAINEK